MQIKNKVRVSTFWLLSIFMMNALSAEPQDITFGHGKVKFVGQSKTINVEVAITKAQINRGLMYRESLDQESGMLFINDQQEILKVWMKNTLIPLDIVFISQQGAIVGFINALQPCVQVPCEIYDSPEPAKYMLELNIGMILNKNLKIGGKALFFIE